jgi:small nuclear ribonucleoprotein (snRNP)-like protein
MNQIDTSIYPPHIQKLIEKQKQQRAAVEADRLTMPVKEGPKTAQLREHLHKRLAVEISDGRRIEGRFMSFDKQHNIVLTECVEIRKTVPIPKPLGN